MATRLVSKLLFWRSLGVQSPARTPLGLPMRLPEPKASIFIEKHRVFAGTAPQLHRSGTAAAPHPHPRQAQVPAPAPAPVGQAKHYSAERTFRDKCSSALFPANVRILIISGTCIVYTTLRTLGTWLCVLIFLCTDRDLHAF